MPDQKLEKVLVVEDEPDIQSIARLSLERIGGLRVEVAGSGPEALETAATFGPDLILLDVMLPGMDGPSTLASLRERFGSGSAPVVFMTAKVRPAEIDAIRRLGALDVIRKPFDPMTLAADLRRIWEARSEDARG